MLVKKKKKKECQNITYKISVVDLCWLFIWAMKVLFILSNNAHAPVWVFYVISLKHALGFAEAIEVPSGFVHKVFFKRQDGCINFYALPLISSQNCTENTFCWAHIWIRIHVNFRCYYSQWALAQLAPPPLIIFRWRVRLWVQGPLGVCNVPIKRKVCDCNLIFMIFRRCENLLNFVN